MTTPADSSRCSRCGAAKPADAPCPHCLLELGLSLPGDPDVRKPRTSSAAPDPAELARHFPGLEIQELVGQGGMGVVYRARHKKLDRSVALKILAPELSGDPAFAERFLREARAMARLDHPNIVAVHDFGETDGLCWLLMEFVDGTNLRQVMASGALTPAQALAIVPQLCDALQAAHDLGVVHRDIKPENVLLDRAGKVKIADFGLAKLSGPGGFEPGLTSTAAAMGTLHYMAPEQLLGAHTVDHRADIFSLGVVFYEMLTGQLPLGRFEPPSRRVAADVRMDVRIDEIVLRALEQEPSRRYQHAVEVKTDVQAVGQVASAPARPLEAAGPAPSKHRWFHRFGARARGRHGWAMLSSIAGVCLFPLMAREMWERGWPGLLFLASVYAWWLYLETMHVASKDSGFGEARARWSKFERSAREAAFFLPAVLGLAALGAGVEGMWELGTDQYVSSTAHAQARAEPWSEDYGYRLLRQLPATPKLDPDPPELGAPNRNRYRRRQLSNSAATLVVAGALLLLAGAVLGNTRAKTAWRVVLSPVIAAGVVVLFAFVQVQAEQTGGPETLHGIGGTVHIQGDIERVRAELAAALEAEERTLVFEIGETLVEKRTREPLARHELLAAVPRSPFARWALDGGGPRRKAPGVVFDAVGTLDGSLTVLSWDAGMVRDGEREGERWRGEVEALLEGVRHTVESE